MLSTGYNKVWAARLIWLSIAVSNSGCAADAPPPAPKTLAAPFIGSWQVALPNGDGVIVNAPKASCDAPVVITQGRAQGEEQSLIYNSPKTAPSEMYLLEFNDRITWMPPGNLATTMIAQTKDKDTFWLYTATMGKADWNNPLEYKRCKTKAP